MKKNIIYLLLATIIISSCGENDDLDTTILINFSHEVDNQTVSSNSLDHTNEAGENYNVKTLKYILSDIKLLGNETEILLKDFHYVDINDPSTMSIESDMIENGSYTLSFIFGIDADSNFDSLLVNYPFYQTMVWPPTMGGGCHYMKLEGAYNNDSTFYNTHTGPTTMIGMSRMDYSFPVSFNMFNINIDNSTGNLEYSIEMNINNWYSNPNTVNLDGAIMMNMSKQMQLRQNGMTDVFSIQGILD
jgi:hypothetical protein